MFSKLKYLFFIILVLFLNYAMAGDCIEVGQKEPSNWRDGEKEIKIVHGKAYVLNVRMNELDFDLDSNEVKHFLKESEDGFINVDSMVYSDGTTYVNTYIGEGDSSSITEKLRTGVVRYTLFEKSEIKVMLSIGEKKEDLYEADGTLKPFYREVRGDTAFINIGYQDHGCAFHIIDVDELNEKQTEKKSASRKKKSSKKKRN